MMRTVSNRLLALGFALGILPARLARWYVPAGNELRIELKENLAVMLSAAQNALGGARN
jgi:hypothetical protein